MMWNRSDQEEDDTLDVAAAMRELASRPLGTPATPAPSASYLWWKAELLRRWDAEQRAVEPVEVGGRIGAGLGVVGAAAILFWLGGRVELSLPSLFLGDDTGLTLPWVLAATIVFCALAIGATAMALFDVGGRDRKE